MTTLNKIWGVLKTATLTAWNWVMRYPVALVISVLVVLVAAALMLLGVGDRFNPGGIIARLFGRDAEDPIDVANTVDEDRDEKIGEEDDAGFVQRPVAEIEKSSNPFRDKKVVRVKDSEGKRRRIRLPSGVEDIDVRQVVEIKPGAFEIRVKSKPDFGDLTLEDLDEMEGK